MNLILEGLFFLSFYILNRCSFADYTRLLTFWSWGIRWNISDINLIFSGRLIRSRVSKSDWRSSSCDISNFHVRNWPSNLRSRPYNLNLLWRSYSWRWIKPSILLVNLKQFLSMIDWGIFVVFFILIFCDYVLGSWSGGRMPILSICVKMIRLRTSGLICLMRRGHIFLKRTLEMINIFGRIEYWTIFMRMHINTLFDLLSIAIID